VSSLSCAEGVDEGVCVVDAELIAEHELEAEGVAAADDEGVDVDVAMPDDELKAEVVAVLLAVAVLVCDDHWCDDHVPEAEP